MRSVNYSRKVKLAMLVFGCMPVFRVHAQNMPTATRDLRISVFAGGTVTFTGLNSSHNLGIMAGADLGFHPFFSLDPSLEVRGAYAIDKGHTDSQKNVLGGLTIAKTYARFHPYSDALFGHGQINYRKGYPNPDGTFSYIQSVSNILSPGVGLDIALSDRLSLKADIQFQRYSTPVTESGHLYSKPLTVGAVYRFNCGGSPRRR